MVDRAAQNVFQRGAPSPAGSVPGAGPPRQQGDGTGATPPRTSGASTPAERAVPLDRLRGLALVAMLVHHLTDWFSGDARGVIPGWPLFAVTDVAAVAFFVTAGASVALLLASREDQGMSAGRRALQVLRRYGLLVPFGMGLMWALRGDPWVFGVLQALGVTVVVGAAVAAVLPTRLLAPAALGALMAGIGVQRALQGDGSWWASEVLRGTFPVVIYLGFVLVGIAAVRSGVLHDRVRTVAAAAVGIVATWWLLVRGTPPARYPGDVEFVVPGLTGTVLVHALAQASWPVWLHRFDRFVRRAGTHTFGLFVSHYAVWWALDRADAVGDLGGPAALTAALVVAAVFCLVAPHVPQPPWSLRTGRRRARRPARPPSPPCPTSRSMVG